LRAIRCLRFIKRSKLEFFVPPISKISLFLYLFPRGEGKRGKLDFFGHQILKYSRFFAHRATRTPRQLVACT
jgi:hypothetical protein